MGNGGRKFLRISHKIQIKLQVSEGKNYLAETIDVSDEGMRIITKDKYITIIPGTEVKVICTQENLSDFCLLCQSRHYSLKENGQTVVGFQIINENEDEEKKKWLKIIRELQEDN